MIHYMDDILIDHPDRTHLQTVLQDLTQALTDRGLKIAPEKIQINLPITYLRRVIRLMLHCNLEKTILLL